MGTKLDDLMSYIKLIANHQRSMKHADGNLWGYELIEKYGMLFPKVMKRFPKGVKKGKLKACYENAYLLARMHPHKYIYVEGCAAGIIPVMHAWCVTPDLKVVDNTWWGQLRGYGDSYFGIPMDIDWVTVTLLKQKTYGILENFKVVEQLKGIEWLHEKWRVQTVR